MDAQGFEMHVISRKKLKTFYLKHAESKNTLLSWHSVISKGEFVDLEELRKSFPQVDYVAPFCVFNIGRACRVIAAIHFNRQKVYVRHVLTYAEYDRGKWKNE